MSVHLYPYFRDVHMGDILNMVEDRHLNKTWYFNVLKVLMQNHTQLS